MTRGKFVGVAVVVVVGVGVVAGVLAAGGSGDDSDEVRTVQPGAPGEETRELSDEDAEDLEGPEHTPADTSFMQRMIVHHGQALAMTALVEGRTERDDLPLLAERITVSQKAEIDQMEQWLADRGEDVPDPPDHQGHDGVPGMATADQLTQLEQVRGPAFDRLFLDLMIAHHQGALAMVEELYREGGGLEPTADRFAREAEADQSIEIQRMQELLAALRHA